MPQQLDLFGNKEKVKYTEYMPDASTYLGKPKLKPEALAPPAKVIDHTYTIEKLTAHVENEMYLWDMRCWDERSEEEAAKWVADIKAGGHDHKNCGHAFWCIKNLLERNVPPCLIVNSIMRNTQIQYANRRVKCFGGAEDWKDHPCPKVRDYGHYGRDENGVGICDDCQTHREGSHPSTRPQK